MDLPVMPPVKPMLAKASKEFPEGNYLYEPKWDGFRCLVFRDGAEVEFTSRNQKPLGRYFPELLEPVLEHLPPRCVIDGELVIPAGSGLDFDLLQQRIHPAKTRVEMLSRSTPANFVAFDILALDDLDLRDLPMEARRDTLVKLLHGSPAPILLTPATSDSELAVDWFERFDGGGFDGVMAKPLDGTYEHDKRTQVKVKHRRTVDCVVAGYSEHKNGGVGSLKLGLFGTDPDGNDVLHHVGVCSAFSASQRRTLAAELRPLEDNADVGHPWRFVGAGSESSQIAEVRVPGMPSRWSGGKTSASWIPLRCERVVEVTCENFSGMRFRHPARFLRWREDKEPQECLTGQLSQTTPVELADLFG